MVAGRDYFLVAFPRYLLYIRAMKRSLLALCLVFAFATSLLAQNQLKKKLLLLAQGPDGHPAQTHEYVAGLTILQKLLEVGSSRVDLQACKLEYSIVSPK